MAGVKNPMPGVIYMPADRLAKYVAAGELPATTLVEALCASFRKHADRTALCTASGDVTYGELDRITDRFAAALVRLGLEPLDRVLFQSANSPELIYAVIGCFKAGLIPVCTLAGHRESEIGYLGKFVDARAHIVQADDAKFDLPAFALRMKQEMPIMQHIISLWSLGDIPGVLRMEDLMAAEDPAQARDLVASIPRDPFQVAIFQLSGGTSGVPKVIPRMQNDYLLNATLTSEWLGYRMDDVMFNPMPMIHNACMICFWLPTLLIGAAFVIAEDMSPEAWASALGRSKPSFIGLIRALFPRLDAALEICPTALDRLRAIWSPDAARMAREKYKRPAYGMFGMSEGMNMYCREGDPEEVLDWMVGRPMSRFDEVRLVEPGTDREVGPEEIGELTCRGPYTLSGYYNAPERNIEAFTPDGFYKSGDLMIKRVIAGKTYYAFAGRTKDVVDRGTEKINCEEVENAVSTHAAISACAVVGMPDEVLGERVCVYLVVRPGQIAPDIPALQAHLQSLGLAKFKWPERIEVIDALPLTKIGKLDKAALRKDIVARLSRKMT